MSFMRFWSKPPASGTPAPPNNVVAHNDAVPSITLLIPSERIFMTTSGDEQREQLAVQPREDVLLSGEVQIFVPPGMGVLHYQSLEVSLRTQLRVDMGPSRMGEKDLLQKTTVKFDKGIDVNEGLQTFAFSIIIPVNIAPHDWHPIGGIENILEAQLTPSTGSCLRSERLLLLVYNPNPSGTLIKLDETLRGVVPELGEYEISLRADVWGVSSLLSTKLNLPHLSARTSIFAFHADLLQKVIITSPRDSKSVTSTMHFPIIREGTRPSKEQLRGSIHPPALWISQKTHGLDQPKEFRIQANGRLPFDDTARPSTLPGIETPIHVSHTLVIELYYANFGETNSNSSDTQSGPTGLRVMRATLPVILPSCALFPSTLFLPNYDTTFAPNLETCPTCNTPIEDTFCLTCPENVLPHIRHDFPPERVGNARGVCETCDERRNASTARTLHGRSDCACGLSLEYLIKRARLAELERVRDEMGGEAVETRKLGVEIGDAGVSESS